jgi:NAD(P)H-dependent FMN reductase
VARWVEQLAEAHGGFDVELVDLAEVGLPVFDEPNHPRLRRYEHQHTKDWSATVDRADAYVFVVPEYNHSFPASVKNALDYLSLEWADKPAGLVSYGGVSAGLRAATALKPVLAALRMVPVVEAVSIPFFAQFLSDDDEFVPNTELEAGGKAMLDELARLAPTLRRLREPEAA